MRFHQAVAFLPTADLVALAVACDELGFDGIYLSDHLFNPRDLRSRYTYSTAPDGSPPWPKETEWPDPMTLIAYLAGRTGRLLFTTGIYVAPVRDLVTVAKSVGTAAVVSGGRVRLGVGSGWCEEEFDATGQDFHNRGRRLDEMIGALRALWSGGWVEHHGTYYDIPPCQMNPSPPSPVPIYGGGGSDAAIKRATEHCDIGSDLPDQAAVLPAGLSRREESLTHLVGHQVCVVGAQLPAKGKLLLALLEVHDLEYNVF